MKNISKKIPICFLLALVLSAGIYLVYTNPFSKNQNNETSTQNNEDIEEENIQEDITEDEVDVNIEIYQKYVEYTLGSYNSEAPKDKYIVAMLEDVSDIVKTYDRSNLIEITPTTELPEIDLSTTKTFSYFIDDKEKIEIKYIKDENYTTPYSQIYLTSEVIYKEKDISPIKIRENGDFKGELSLHIFNNTQLKYPIIIIGEQNIFSSRDEKVVYLLIDGELVRYKMKWEDESVTETFKSTIDVDVYIDKQDNKTYIYSYWEDPAFVGLKITRWSINYDEKVIQREASIIEVER